ncbi:urea amidolyase associated protein UAAP1 [Endothiovibrio diazotrophicus]
MTQTDLDPTRVVHRESLPGARNWSFIIRRGFTLRLTDPNGGANVSLLAYNAAEKLERYNAADTLKAQHTAFLTKGHVCYSDMGRVLLSLTEDSCGWHDTMCGVSNAEEVRRQYGEGRYQELRNGFHRNGRELFLIELGKWGLGKRDLVANLNLFSKVTVDDSGALHFHEGHSKAGDFVDLRAEMDTLVVLNTCPHPLDLAHGWNPKPVELAIWRNDPPGDDDPCRTSCEENRRGFDNTAIYHCQYGGADR